MCHTFELIEFWSRLPGTRLVEAREPTGPPSEAEALREFQQLQMLVPEVGGGGPGPIPEHLREAIRWAEQMKDEHGLN